MYLEKEKKWQQKIIDYHTKRSFQFIFFFEKYPTSPYHPTVSHSYSGSRVRITLGKEWQE